MGKKITQTHLRLEDGTTWRNPCTQEVEDIGWRCVHQPKTVTEDDMYIIAQLVQEYRTLIDHPAFTLRIVKDKVKWMRKEILNYDKT